MGEIKYREEEEMKDSGVEWLGNIPKEWTFLKNKYIFCEINKRSVSGKEELLSVSEYYGVAPRKDKIGETDFLSRADSLIGYKKCLVGDIVMNIMLAWKKSVGVTKWDGIISPSYAVFRLIDAKNNSNYFSDLFRTDRYALYFKAFSTGVIDSRLRLYPDEFLSLYSHYPSYDQQQKIANFLDIKTAQFDSIILKKELLIKKLEEAKKSLISEVVTGKVKIVDGEMVKRKPEEMKDSGVEWLGMIPKDWERTKLKFNTYVKGRIGWQGLRSDEFIEYGPFLVTGTDFIDSQVNWNTCYHITEKRYKEAPSIHLKNEDLLVTKDGSIGKLAIVKDCPYKAVLNSGIFVTRCINGKYFTKYMYYILSSRIFDVYIDLKSFGSTIRHLYQETFVNFAYALPSLKEQKELIDYLDNKISDILNLIDKTKLQIQRLKQAKQSLISEAVTGKIDLRDWEIIEEGEEQ